MLIKVYKYKFHNKLKKLIKSYSQIEIPIEKYRLLIHSSYFEMVPQRGRPRAIWHESWVQELMNYCIPNHITNEKDKYLYLTEKYFLNLYPAYIESKEFEEKIWNNKKSFIDWNYGD